MTNEMPRTDDLPTWVDKRLWIRIVGCDGFHYLMGNPHTFPGRMATWCSRERRGITISKHKITDHSEEAKLWIEGFLHGNEPGPPEEDDEASEQALENARAMWRERVREFHETGVWPESPESMDSET